MSRFPRLPSVVRDVLPVAAIGLLVFQGLRMGLAERYVVPTASMEPTLHGDPDHGDVVLVETLSAWLGPSLQRYDLMVVQSQDPAAPDKHVVKRVVAFGDEPDKRCLRLEDGDLWLGPDPQRLQREAKHPIGDRDLRVAWFRVPPARAGEPIEQFLNPGPASIGPDAIALPPASGDFDRLRRELTDDARRRRLDSLPPRILPDGFFGLARPVDSSWLDAEGRRGGRNTGQVVVNDFGAELDVVPGRGLTDLLLALDLRPDSYAFRYRADGSATFLRNGEPVAEVAIRGPALAVGTATRIEFGFLDGRFFLIAGGRLLDWRERPREWQDRDGLPEPRTAPRTMLSLAGLGGPCSLGRLVIFRDLYWFRERVPFGELRDRVAEVPQGSVYLLGDNSFDSQDSRTFGPWSLSAYVGRPVAVLGPWPRHRVLLR